MRLFCSSSSRLRDVGAHQKVVSDHAARIANRPDEHAGPEHRAVLAAAAQLRARFAPARMASFICLICTGHSSVGDELRGAVPEHFLGCVPVVPRMARLTYTIGQPVRCMSRIMKWLAAASMAQSRKLELALQALAHGDLALEQDFELHPCRRLGVPAWLWCRDHASISGATESLPAFCSMPDPTQFR